MHTPAAIAVIPARFASTRFPGKPLADKTGKPLIQHVVEAVQPARHISQIIVATDDQRIFDAVEAFGGQAMMTSPDHPNGTSRIAEVVERLTRHSTLDTPDKGGPAGRPPNRPHTTPDTRHPTPQIIVNVQGDEPDIEPSVIDELIEGLHADPDAPMATLASDFAEDEDPADPNIVKLVIATINGRHRAMYFSRALIPHDRDNQKSKIKNQKCLKHPGLYAYRRQFLLEYVTLPPTPLEQMEKLEQLRALEHGHPIAVIKTSCRHHGIDTPEQYEAFVQRFNARQAHAAGDS